MTALPRRKSSPRLCGFDYTGPHSYFVTCDTYRKRHYFREKAVFDIVYPVMEQTSMENGFGIYVYCFMPDHLHLLLLGQETSSLPKFMKTFKQRSSYILKNTLGGVLWQRSYYDHVLRKEEVLRDVAMYVLNNPVRARLVDNYLDYPFSGSAMFYIKDIDGQT